MNKRQFKTKQMLELSDINFKEALTMFCDIRVKALEMNEKIDIFQQRNRTVKENQMETQYLK